MILTRVAAAVLMVFAVSVADEEADKKLLAKVEADIKKKPEDPSLHAVKAKLLIKLSRFDEGFDFAATAMELFVKAGDKLAFIILENVDLGSVTVEVRFNMGPKERVRPDTGIVRPVSFKIFKKVAEDEKVEHLETIDFEIGMMGGEPGSAAYGVTDDEGHHNYGMAKADAKYTSIREKGFELIKKRHPEKK